MMGTLAPRWLAVLLLQCVSSLKEWNCSVFGSFNRFYFTKLYNENAEAYLESSRKFMMELFRENS